jgi:hypothetical protein
MITTITVHAAAHPHHRQLAVCMTGIGLFAWTAFKLSPLTSVCTFLSTTIVVRVQTTHPCRVLALAERATPCIPICRRRERMHTHACRQQHGASLSPLALMSPGPCREQRHAFPSVAVEKECTRTPVDSNTAHPCRPQHARKFILSLFARHFTWLNRTHTLHSHTRTHTL